MSYSEKEFLEAYSLIRNNLTTGMTSNSEKCTIVLGGQPGAGKSTFYQMREDLLNYIPINGDEFRRFHPNYADIIKNKLENYTDRTQLFSNQVVETLIEDLGDKGYNLIIEGTLRDPEVPIRTSQLLQEKGYHTTLVVIACDAEESWKSTLIRAEELKTLNLPPRFVSIEAYDKLVHQIPNSLSIITSQKCFDSITIINREGEILYKDADIDTDSDYDPSEILRDELNIQNWEEKYSLYEEMFVEEKDKIFGTDITQDNEYNNDIELIEQELEYYEDDSYEWDKFEL